MSDDRNGIDPDAATRIDGGIARGFAFARSILANPSILDGIPDEGTVVLAPDDDPDLAEAGLAVATRVGKQGAGACLRQIRGDRGGDDQPERWAPGITFRHLSPRPPARWEIDPRRVVLRYDRAADRLLLDLFGRVGTGRSTIGVPDGTGSYLLVDEATQVIAGFLVEGVRTRAAADPVLGNLLRLARPSLLGEDELAAAFHGTPGTPDGPTDVTPAFGVLAALAAEALAA